MEEKRDLLVGIIMGLFSIVYYLGALKIKMYKGLGVSVIDSSEVPKKWAIFLLFLSVMLVIRALRRMKKNTGSSAMKDLLVLNKEVALTFVLLAFYTIFLKQIGFVVATFIYISLQTLVLSKKEKRNYKMTIILALVFSVLIDYVFVELLSVLLPKGLIGF